MAFKIDARIDRAISNIDLWLGSNCWAADPRSWNTRQHAIMKRKSFAELALYLYLVKQWNSTCDLRLYDLVRQVATSDDYIDLMARSPGKALLYGMPFLTLSAFGDLPGAYLDRLRSLLMSRGVLGTERLPHRQLDLWHFMTALGLPAPFDGFAASKFGLLQFPPSPILCDTRDAYGLTHNIFYITNFGITTPKFPSFEPDNKDGLVHCLHSLSAKVLFEGNIDLLLEIAICQLILTSRRGPITCLIVEHALSLLECDGVLSSPENSDVAEIGRDVPEEAEWFKRYHTMSVAAIAFRIFSQTIDTTDSMIIDSPISERELLVYGEIMTRLMEYRLIDAADLIKSAGQSKVHSVLRPLYDEAVLFIEDQKRMDGSYGYFPDEIHILKAGGGEYDDFYPIQQEIDTAISSVLLQRKSL